MEQEKTNILNKKLEILLSQFPAILTTLLHETEVPDASVSHTLVCRPLENAYISEEQRFSGLKDTCPIPEQQIGGDKCEKLAGGNDNTQMQVGAQVNILCHGIPKRIVAEGIFIGFIDDRGDGPQFCKVGVVKALIANEKLVKPRRDALSIGQAVNKVIQWELANVRNLSLCSYHILDVIWNICDCFYVYDLVISYGDVDKAFFG